MQAGLRESCLRLAGRRQRHRQQKPALEIVKHRRAVRRGQLRQLGDDLPQGRIAPQLGPEAAGTVCQDADRPGARRPEFLDANRRLARRPVVRVGSVDPGRRAGLLRLDRSGRADREADRSGGQQRQPRCAPAGEGSTEFGFCIQAAHGTVVCAGAASLDRAGIGASLARCKEKAGAGRINDQLITAILRRGGPLLHLLFSRPFFRPSFRTTARLSSGGIAGMPDAS